MTEAAADVAEILFIDDEERVLKGLERSLFDEPYTKHFTTDPKKAFEILANHPIQVVVSDMRMPVMDGLTLLRRVKAQYPDTVRIVLSGYTEVNQILASINAGEVFRFITKPFKFNEEFNPAITQALDMYAIKKKNRELLERLSTHNQKLEQAVAKQTASLQAALKKIEDELGARTRFLSKLARDIHGPVVAIQKTLVDLSLPTQKVPSLEETRLHGVLSQQCGSLRDLVNHMMKYAHLKQEGVTVPGRLIDAAALIEQCIQTHRRNVGDEALGSVDIQTKLFANGSVELWIDEGVLMDMISPLIDHALSRISAGCVMIVAQQKPEVDRSLVEVLVTSTGDSLSKDQQHQLFDVFSGADAESSGTVHSDASLGWAMTIAKEVAHAMDGDILFQEHEKLGNLFKVSFYVPVLVSRS